ncbi:MAG: hypothetical protein HKP58_19115 [Desulfatitalea sp.]|nr:outer membrane protein transport protein [Desulfatitalea sp.]NNK02526.1 hypothetical protein [Desulfatitalea sp.]
MKRLICSILLLSILTCTIKVFAAAYTVPTIGTKGMGMASAFTAVADDPTAIMYNSAGLTQLKEGQTYLYGDVNLTYTTSEFSFSEFTTGGVTYPGDDSSLNMFVQSIEFYAARSFGNFAGGVAVYPAYGTGGFSFDNVTAPSLMGTVRHMTSASGYFSFTGALACKLTPNLSVGVTGEVLYGLFESKTERDITIPAGPLAGTYDFALKQEGNGFGGSRANFGILYAISPNLKIGENIKTPTKFTIEGTQTVSGNPGITTLPANGETDYISQNGLPWEFNTGISYDVTPEFTVSLVHWFRLYSQVSSDVGLAAPTSEKTCDDIHNFGAGANWKVSPVLQLRAGVMYNTELIKTEYLTAGFNNLNAAISPSAGVSYNLTQNTEISLAFQYTHFFPRTSASGERIYGNAIRTMVGATYTF